MAVRDRTLEFKEHIKKDIIVCDMSVDSSPEEDEEDLKDEDLKDELGDFYMDVSIIKKGLDRFESNLDRLDSNFKIYINRKKNFEDLEDLFKEQNQLTNLIKNKLKLMKEDIYKIESADVNFRIRSNIYNFLVKKFINILNTYHQLKSFFDKKMKERVDRQSQIINGDLHSSVQIEIKSKRYQESIVNVKEQHRDISILEQNIMELHQIFIDVATLVESQDDLVNDIEYNCQQASAWTGETVKELKTTNNFQKKRRKRCCGCCTCFGGALCAICATGAGYIMLGLAPLASCTIC